MAVGSDRALPPERPLSPETRNRMGGFLLLGAGAVLVLVSLFLDWFEPGNSAWTIFEVWDIVLAALALAAIAAAAGAMGLVSPRPDIWALAPAVGAPVVVIVSLLNHPPAAQGLGDDPMTGIWLALAGSLLMVIGAVLSVARISVALDRATPGIPATPPAAPGAPVTPPGGPIASERPETTPTRRVVP